MQFAANFKTKLTKTGFSVRGNDYPVYAVSCALCLYSSINSATSERTKKPGSENAGYENDANSSPMVIFRFVICQENPFNEKTTDSHSRKTGK